jgi:septal ring factor EnvC (AmiA/AmiB activator)
MNIILLSFILFLLISILLFINLEIGFKPLKKNTQNLFFLEKFEDSTDCSESKTVDSIRSCFKEVVNGKNNYIQNLESKIKKTSNKNTSDISNINKQIIDINNSIDTIKKNVENSSSLLKKTQNDILSKANQTTDTLKKAQEAKDKADAATSN